MAFLGGDMSNHRVRVFSTTFKEEVVRRLESGEALAAVAKQLGIARKLLYEWRWAWRRHGAAGLNRRRGPKKGLRRKMATGDPPGAALARIEELERLVGRQQLDLDFFRKALRLADALQGPAPARGETNSSRSSKILARRRSRKAKTKRRARPRKAIHEIQYLCQLAQLSRAGYYRHLAPCESKRDDADIRDAIHRIALSDRFYGYRKRMRSIRLGSPGN